MIAALLFLVGIAQLPTAWAVSRPECVKKDAYHVDLQPSELPQQAEGTRLNFTCSTNLEGVYPKWTINNQVYEITFLPPGFIATESSLSFIFQASAEVTCFLTIQLDGEFVSICSEPTLVEPIPTHGVGPYPHCKKEGAIFSIGTERSHMFMDIDNNRKSCNYSVNISTCDGDGDSRLFSGTNIDNATMQLAMDSYFGKNVTVTANCTCGECKPVRFFLPNVTRTVRLPLTRNRAHYVPLGNISKEYCPNANNVDNICVQEEGSHECHKSLENGQIQFRLNMSSGNATSVSLKVDDKVKNGTIVSLFCTARDCRNKFSNVMLFNIEIILVCEDCDVNAECEEEQCVCKEDYTGNGKSCDPFKTSDGNGLGGGAIAGITVAVIFTILGITIIQPTIAGICACI